ncbi:S9 family peptidase [Alkalimonas amylolytica]|uniref:Dipeptidyl aminopeptidase/acylaminoacyl peptidase n=1 Tax=Alkalimonas amylolytica TaxID=152573 RepID=A0A1H4G449_ALKAM|nr:S9 family peptidase [Alkalimonas amylolytica]SEB04091.1 Dipeptidyl aminopeptidase/acylaminoacyl peptidase [Alkalimonas amylolytica]
MKKILQLLLPLFLLWTSTAIAQQVNPLKYDDVFHLELVTDPQVNAKGDQIVFVRNWFDRQTDRRRMALWIMNADGSAMQPLTQTDSNASSPRWSPDQKRIAYVEDGQIHVLWLDSGRSVQISQLPHAPANLAWSPDGNWLSFNMFTAKSAPPPVTLPGKPANASWAPAPIYIDSMQYRADGAGYLPSGYRHHYMMAAEGGSAIQLTTGDYHHSGDLSWQADGKAVYFAANRREAAYRAPLNSAIYRLTLADRSIEQIYDPAGPASQPMLSPDGRQLAFLGFEDRKLAHQANRLYVMNLDGSNVRNLTEDLDRHINAFQWQSNSRGLYIQYDDLGLGKVAEQPLRGNRSVLVTDLGGTSFSRPYSGGQFSVADNGLIAYTQASTERPSELAMQHRRTNRTLTNLNRDLLFKRTIGQVEEIWYQSSVDGKQIHGWVMYPPGFDASKQYPLILEIHGGPHTAYGPVFAMELQLMAAQGYVVLYTNPRGSTSYGEDFANLIHHNYPSYDYNDLMDGVDAVLARGFINEQELFITGGSGGGVLTTWAIGHTDRFAAAAAINPVINWYSFVLNADMYNYFTQYWFPGLPWEMPEHYLKHSPISYVGNVTTPTMLFTGDADYRTPISETEQYYQALQLRGIDTAMVRIPGASHALHARPSNLMAKPAYVIHWFERYRQTKSSD